MGLTYVESNLYKFVKSIASVVCKQYKLKAKSITVLTSDDPDQRGNKGLCTSDGEISIALRQGRKGRFETIEELIDTTIHELAHLKHHDHSKDFWKLHRKMKKWFKLTHVNPA